MFYFVPAAVIGPTCRPHIVVLTALPEVLADCRHVDRSLGDPKPPTLGHPNSKADGADAGGRGRDEMSPLHPAKMKVS